MVRRVYCCSYTQTESTAPAGTVYVLVQTKLSAVAAIGAKRWMGLMGSAERAEDAPPSTFAIGAVLDVLHAAASRSAPPRISARLNAMGISI